jgi:Tol biopolymer transport system component
VAQVACGGGDPTLPVPIIPARTTGNAVVIAEEHGNGRDADGFTVAVDGGDTHPLTYDVAVRYDSLKPGDHTFRIVGVAPHCRATENEQVLKVKAGVTDTVRMRLTCIGGLAYHQYVSSTQFDIAYLTEDGHIIQLATGPEKKFIVAWSPDGSRMVYEKEEGSDYHKYTVKADGTDTRRHPSTGVVDWPRWSRDGSRLAFGEFDAVNGGSSIVISDPDGANRRVITNRQGVDFNPDWSPDGSRLYFGCTRYGRFGDLCTSAVDGSGLRPIRYAVIDSIEAARPKCTANVCAYIVNPNNFEVSPDGRNILFNLYPYNLPQTVWVGALDGSHATSLSGSVRSFSGRWSPTGERALFGIWDGTSGYAIATAKPDGSEYRQLTSFAIQDEAGDFSPDGAIIAFDGFRGAGQQIWVMNADGSGGRQITFGDPQGFAPHWNPRARATGTLAGGQPSASRQASRAIIGADAGESASVGRTSVCHPVRDGSAVRISCPGSR